MICNLVHLQINDLNGGVIHYRLSTSNFDVSFNGNTYTSTGDLLKITNSENTNQISKTGIKITMSGLDPAFLTEIDSGAYLRAPIDIYTVNIPDGTNVVSSYAFYHRGYCDTPVTGIDYTSNKLTVEIETTNVFTDIDKTPSLMRSSLSAHASIHSGDKFFQYVADIDITEIWKK